MALDISKPTARIIGQVRSVGATGQAMLIFYGGLLYLGLLGHNGNPRYRFVSGQSKLMIDDGFASVWFGKMVTGYHASSRTP